LKRTEFGGENFGPTHGQSVAEHPAYLVTDVLGTFWISVCSHL